MNQENSDKEKELPESSEDLHTSEEPNIEGDSAGDDSTDPPGKTNETDTNTGDPEEEVTQLEIPAFDVESPPAEAEAGELESELLEEPPLPEFSNADEIAATELAPARLEIQSDEVEHPAAGVSHEDVSLEVEPVFEVDAAPEPDVVKRPPWLILYNEKCPYSYEEGQVLQQL
ncbi:MAG: hypothetical protein QF473_36470, partial [Planctomycetota bacterium]|nr:hypothetical protein [Planctomycetota bacterium]